MTNTHLYDELGLRPVLAGSHKVTLVTPMEKTEIEQMSCHLTAFSVTVFEITLKFVMLHKLYHFQ